MKRTNPQSLDDMNYADYCDALADERYVRRASAQRDRMSRIPADVIDGKTSPVHEARHTPSESGKVQ